MKVVIVGGVAGGASAAARLRRLDESAEIIMFERGEYISFANCGLPYYIGGEITKKSALTLQTPQSFNARFNVDVRVNSEVTSIDPKAKTVTVRSKDRGEYTESYDKLILSPGAAPIRPPMEGADNARVFTLRNIPDTIKIREYVEEEFPESAVVVGGGYIGVEMAENLKNAGVAVTIVELADHVIAPLDYDMACDVHRYLKEKGVGLILKNGVQAIKEEGGKLKLTLSDGEIETDMVIMAVGVRPDTALAKDAGLELNKRGAIVVNEHMLTSDPDIYAVGDAVEVTDFVTGEKAYIPLAGPANKQGRIAADNICGIPTTYKNTLGSAVLKIFDMTVATTGVNERAAKAAGLDYDKVYTYSNSHASYYPGSTGMSIKTLYEKGTGKILGAQIVGFDGVDKRCDVLATAIRAGMTAKDLTELELCYAPPFGSAKDPVNFVGYVIENTLAGRVKNFFWDDVAKLPRDGSVTLLDVRTDLERENGQYIEGFIHIPVDELRARAGELDKSKPVYIHCRTGLRSYVACCMLAGMGFDCYNLSGGWRLYESILSETKSPEHGCYDPN
ncbi:FAD-dependent oxidoreductase [Hydrogenoanaerobacterium saccharovorans]|uniref:FAD-dependent oxidoreductase n=1 Tax=Hydrogenoanaerobacterium saccharovorans TaxID=474960 RepID=A0ABS2GLG8_9FIRM|nr:FAD-dependent oxidoreductase [Hydrogenoanaerobacterium saccharovorans]MBM6923307.1 FAD-dependent oxidoreductase [Hydrogenoanaerobacterium saccharovorans]